MDRNGLVKSMMCVVAAVVLTVSSAWAGVVTDTLKSSLDQFIVVLKDPDLKKTAKKQDRRNKLHTLFLKTFDEVEFSRKALGKHWKVRTDAEKKEFIDLFVELMERTYFDKIDAYLTQNANFTPDNIKYLNEKVGKKYAVVETRVNVNAETKIPIHYRLKNNKGTWLICDIAIEGVSLLKNYRVQFNEILTNESFPQLIKRLKEKQKNNVVASST